MPTETLVPSARHAVDRLADSPDQTAALLGCSRQYVYKMLRDGTLPSFRLGRSRKFDADPWLLNCTNGVLDLRTGQLGDHDPTLRLTKITDTAYQPDAVHDDVTAILQAVHDDVRPWLAKALGQTLVGDVIEDLVLILDGSGPNGKTTIVEAVNATLGDYATTAASKLIMHGGHDEHPTIKADLRGVRFAAISETEEGGYLRAEQVKALSGGDTIKARFMRADYFEFTPSHHLVIATNHRPRVSSNEHALWRRLRLVPFPYRYVEPHLAGPDDLIADKALRGRVKRSPERRAALLAWLVAGCRAWQAEGIGGCQPVDEATRAWRESEDLVTGFLAEHVDFGQGEVGGKDLYDAFVRYSDDQGARKWSNKRFSNELLAHPAAAAVRKIHLRAGARYLYLTLRSTDGF